MDKFHLGGFWNLFFSAWYHHWFSDAFMICTLHLSEGYLHDGKGNSGYGSVMNSRLQWAVTVLKVRGGSCNNVQLVGDEIKTSLQETFLWAADDIFRQGFYMGISHVYIFSHYRHPLFDLSDPGVLRDQKDWAVFTLHWHQLPCCSGWIYLHPGMLTWWERDKNSACIRYLFCGREGIFLGQMCGTANCKSRESISTYFR